MTLAVTTVKAFNDNYIWLIHDPDCHRRVAVVDPGDALPVREVLARDELELAAILITHHHRDHVGGIDGLRAQWPVPVYGPAAERIPLCSHRVSGGDEVAVEGTGLRLAVIDVPGHTAGHIAYTGHGALFCGDTLFSGGCGRLFEGTASQMTDSLAALVALAPETRVYCAHEYTLANLAFALAVEPGNRALANYRDHCAALREKGEPTLPSSLATELTINPFLRCDEPAIKHAAEARAGRALPSRVEVFAQIRAWKDGF